MSSTDPIKNLDNITNILLLKYDDNFNELYDKILSLNKSITNKEEILVKERLEMKNKDLNIQYLYSCIIFVLLLCPLLLAHANKKINTSKLIGSIILLFLLLLLYCYILYQRSIQVPFFIKKALVDMTDLSTSLVKQTFKNPYTCPANCPAIATEEESAPTSNNFATDITIAPTLNTDPQNNVWGNSDKQLTYYECKWLGGPINGNSLPIEDKNTYSTIPCTYKPNYTQLNQYICNNDPNKNGIENCTKF